MAINSEYWWSFKFCYINSSIVPILIEYSFISASSIKKNRKTIINSYLRFFFCVIAPHLYHRIIFLLFLSYIKVKKFIAKSISSMTLTNLLSKSFFKTNNNPRFSNIPNLPIVLCSLHGLHNAHTLASD